MKRIKHTKYRVENRYYQGNGLYFVAVRFVHHQTSRDLRLLFDTGASHTGLSAAAFESLGIVHKDAAEPTVTALGTTGMKYGIVDSVTLMATRKDWHAGTIRVTSGTAVAQDVVVNVLSEAWTEAMGCFGVSGILGSSFLEKFGFYVGHHIIDVFVPVQKL